MKLEDINVTRYLFSPIKSIVSRPRQIVTAALSVYASSLPGDFLETGVFTGGTSVIMARVIRRLAPEKQLFACDSFKGLPMIQEQDKYAKGCNKCNKGFMGQFRSSRSRFESYIRSENLDNIEIVEGFYHNTLPPNDVKEISFLRLDGDIYNSTMTALVRLYPLVVPNGAVYIDDYGSFHGCKRAVDQYLVQNQINVTFRKVLENNGKVEAVWFLKV